MHKHVMQWCAWKITNDLCIGLNNMAKYSSLIDNKTWAYKLGIIGNKLIVVAADCNNNEYKHSNHFPPSNECNACTCIPNKIIKLRQTIRTWRIYSFYESYLSSQKQNLSSIEIQVLEMFSKIGDSYLSNASQQLKAKAALLVQYCKQNLIRSTNQKPTLVKHLMYILSWTHIIS